MDLEDSYRIVPFRLVVVRIVCGNITPLQTREGFQLLALQLLRTLTLTTSFFVEKVRSHQVIYVLLQLYPL